MSEEYQPDNQWRRLLNRNPKCATVSVEIAGAVLGLSRASAYGAGQERRDSNDPPGPPLTGPEGRPGKAARERLTKAATMGSPP